MPDTESEPEIGEDAWTFSGTCTSAERKEELLRAFTTNKASFGSGFALPVNRRRTSRLPCFRCGITSARRNAVYTCVYNTGSVVTPTIAKPAHPNCAKAENDWEEALDRMSRAAMTALSLTGNSEYKGTEKRMNFTCDVGGGIYKREHAIELPSTGSTDDVDTVCRGCLDHMKPYGESVSGAFVVATLAEDGSVKLDGLEFHPGGNDSASIPLSWAADMHEASHGKVCPLPFCGMRNIVDASRAELVSEVL